MVPYIVCSNRYVMQEGSGSIESGFGIASSTKQIELLQNYHDLIIRRYEKRIRKTHRVANQTEQKLKKQQASLLHFKKELSRHVVKLQELSHSGDPHAAKRLKSIRTKLIQLDKIVPYLGKYISVNRQAEMQTIAVLKESCTVELQKLSQSMKDKPTHIIAESTLSSHSDYSDSAVPSLSPSQFDPPDKQPDENPYASLTEIKQQANNSTVKLRSNYAELDFQKIHATESLRPVSVKYSEVRIDSLGIGRIENNEVEVNIQPSASPPMEIAECDTSCLGTENVSLATNITDHEFQTITEQEQSSTLKRSPPPVAKKPISPVHKLSQHSSFNQETIPGFDTVIDQNTEIQRVVSSTGHNVVLPLQGIPSVMDRIKVMK